MQIGMKEDSVFKLLHPDAKELYSSVCDLKFTCEQCVDPSYRLSNISICLCARTRGSRVASARTLLAAANACMHTHVRLATRPLGAHHPLTRSLAPH